MVSPGIPLMKTWGSLPQVEDFGKMPRKNGGFSFPILNLSKFPFTNVTGLSIPLGFVFNAFSPFFNRGEWKKTCPFCREDVARVYDVAREREEVGFILKGEIIHSAHGNCRCWKPTKFFFLSSGGGQSWHFFPRKPKIYIHSGNLT